MVSQKSLNETGVPILMYHSVEDTAHSDEYKHLYVTKKQFTGQMRDLRRRGYNPITFDQLAGWRSSTAELPDKPILITFDDGYATLERNVHPLLVELNFPYTVFVVTSLAGKASTWVASEGLTPWPIMSWETMTRLSQDGQVSFQPHTCSHPHLAQVPLSNARSEITECRSRMEDCFQSAMDTLCYPFGDFNADVVILTQDLGFKFAVTTQFGRARKSECAFTLPRISVYHTPYISLKYGVAPLNFRWRIETRRDNRPEEATDL